MTEAEHEQELDRSLRAALKHSGPEPPDLLPGFQKKLRQRSGGKFYADGWSTLRHAPVSTYLITSLFMLAVCGVVYAMLAPLAGEPLPVQNRPAPVQIISPAEKP
jgi:hypothetical protein